MAGGRLVWNEAEYVRLTRGRDGAVGRMLQADAEKATQEAKRLCPTSPAGAEDHRPGHLRSSIGWHLGEDAVSLYADIGTDVDYALYVEFPTRPHIIKSHGDYPLRNRRTGKVFGRLVHHPGTHAQPFLRPCLDVLRHG